MRSQDRVEEKSKADMRETPPLHEGSGDQIAPDSQRIVKNIFPHHWSWQTLAGCLCYLCSRGYLNALSCLSWSVWAHECHVRAWTLSENVLGTQALIPNSDSFLWIHLHLQFAKIYYVFKIWPLNFVHNAKTLSQLYLLLGFLQLCLHFSISCCW